MFFNYIICRIHKHYQVFSANTCKTKSVGGAGVLTQWLREPAPLVEDQNSVPGTSICVRQLTIAWNTSSQGANSLF